MKKIIYSIIGMLIIQALITACKEDDPTLGPAPTPEDAVFTYTPSVESDNILTFSNASAAFLKKWQASDGSSAEGNDVVITFPFQGTYEVTLTVYTSGGSVSSSQTVEIAETDLSLLKPVYSLLTGGTDSPDGKTWVIDANTLGHMGIGPIDALAPIWWAAPPNDKNGAGLYDDQYTFRLSGFSFVQETNGDVYVNAQQAGNFPGAYANLGDFTAPYTAPDNLIWSISENAAGSQFLTIANGGFIGYYTGVSKYQILSISEELIELKYEDAAAPGNAWFMRLVPEGFTPPPPPPPATTTLPIDFESAQPPFEGFGGSTYSVEANPDASGINTSGKVGKTEKGIETWAGISTNLAQKLDFSINNAFSLKVLAPKTGVVRFKIEDQANAGTFLEVDASITKVNEWEELTFDFTGTASGTYDKLAIFFDFGSADQSTFYFDDVKLYAAQCVDLSEESVDPVAGLNFTAGSALFGQFGNIGAALVENPFPSGINTSCFVNSYVKNGGCETWSGVGYLLETPLDFGTATKKKFKLKVYAVDQATQVTLRLEKLAHPDTEPSAERIATISATGQWEELTFDFSDITDPNTYKNMIVYFERGQACDGDTYYFDDLVQVQ